MAPVVSGQRLTASLFNSKVKKRVARARRITNSSNTTSTTEVGILRLDDIPLEAGKNYRVAYMHHPELDTTQTDTSRTLLRFTTDGSTPVVGSSGVLAGSGSDTTFNTLVNPEAIFVETDYTPVANEIFSCVLCIRHVAGTAVIKAQADGSVFHTQIWIDDMGDDPGDTGVDL